MLEHGLALLILVGRAGDVASTLYVSPNLVLEANPVARRFKWPTLIAGFGLCAIPYFDIPLAVIVAVPSLFVTASNLTKGWMARALGETELEAVVLRAAARGSLAATLTMCWIAALFVFLAAGSLLWLSGAENELVSCFAIGLAVYGLAIGVHSSFYFVRVFRRARLEARQAS